MQNELILEFPTKSMLSCVRAAAILHHWRPCVIAPMARLD